MIECWLSFNNKEEVLQLPVTPFFTVNGTQLNQVVNLYNLGEINLPGQRGLKTLTIESFLPANQYNFLKTNEIADPFSLCNMIERWKGSRRPIRVIFTETNINLAMLIENFNYGIKDGTRDVYFTLELKEFIFVKARKIAQLPAKKQKKTWTVKYGDTLSQIALKALGDSKKWKQIYSLNKTLIGNNPHTLKHIKGKVLRLE